MVGCDFMDYLKDRTIVLPAPLEVELRGFVAEPGERHGYLVGRVDRERNRYICDALCVSSKMDQFNVAEMVAVRQKMVNFKMLRPEYTGGIVVHTQHREINVQDKSRYNVEMQNNHDFIAIVYSPSQAGVKRSIVRPKSASTVHVEIATPDRDFERRRREIMSSWR